MSFVLKFCKYLLIPILSEWLSAFELVDFDTSLCNAKDRPQLIELIREFPGKFVPALVEVALLSELFIDWCHVRRIRNQIDHWKLKVTSRSLSHALLNCSQLSHQLLTIIAVTISFEIVNASQKYAQTIVELISKASKAETIEFSGFVTLHKTSLSAILQAVSLHCPHLKHLTLPESPNEDSSSVGAMQQLFHTAPGLTRVSVVSRSYDTARIASSLVVHCQDLNNISLQCSDAMPRKAVALISLMGRCKQLTSFTGRPLSDKTLLALIWYKGRALTSLNLSNSYEITDASVADLGEACPVLRSLNLSECHRVSDVGLTALAVSPLKATLESLNLGGLMSIQYAVLALGTHCTRLTSLELRRHRLVDLSTLSSPCFSGLRCLSIIFLGIDDTGLEAIAARCRGMEELTISHNPLVTDASVVRVAECCSGLRVLNMKTLAKITDVTLFALAEHCPLLVDLGLTACSVTDEGLVRVAERCCRLERVVLHLLPKVSLKALVALADNCDHMKALCFSSGLIGDKHAEFGALLRRFRRLQSISVGPAMPYDSLYFNLAKVVSEVNSSIAFVWSDEFHLTSTK